jgi:hypothetical protein
VDPTSAHLTLDDLRLEPTIYLLPEWETNEEALEHLAEVSDEIFEEQLNGCYRVPSVWPECVSSVGGSSVVFIRWLSMSATNACGTRICDRAGLESDIWTDRRVRPEDSVLGDKVLDLKQQSLIDQPPDVRQQTGHLVAFHPDCIFSGL